MPTSVTNFNFLAQLVSDIWGGPKIKSGSCWSPQTPLADKCLHVAIVPANTNQRTKLQLSSSISFRDKEGVPKFNVGATSPLPYLYAETFMYARSTLQGQTVCQISASYRYASGSYANMYYHYICPKMGFLSVLRVKMWKYCFFIPKRHYPAWIRVCWCIAYHNRFNGLSSKSVGKNRVQRRILKQMSGNFGYMGRSNHRGDLYQMSLVWRYGGHNHVCNIWWLSGCGCGERGKFAFSHWLDESPLQHWS